VHLQLTHVHVPWGLASLSLIRIPFERPRSQVRAVRPAVTGMTLALRIQLYRDVERSRGLHGSDGSAGSARGNVGA
jgi:hypothetical protein